MTRTSPAADAFRLGQNFTLGVAYDPALSRSEAMKAKILQFGIEEIAYRDREHFYFQAPGGQVYRLAGIAEDMSGWQRPAQP